MADMPFLKNAYFYYGCHVRLGHYLHDTDLKQVDGQPDPFPCNWQRLDGGFLPKRDEEQVEGLASLTHFGRYWTVLSFWDRSVDHRKGSCSTFVMPFALTFEEACQRAEMAFPKIWKRFTFPIVQRTL